MTDSKTSALTATIYAAVGTDGRDPVVWGLGASTEAAVADAEGQEVDCGPLCTVVVTPEQAADITSGVVDCAVLGIELTASDIRAITG